MTIWHTKEEKPDNNRVIIYELQELIGSCIIYSYYNDFPRCDRWCYLEDYRKQLQEKTEKIEVLDSNIITLLNVLNRKDEEKEEIENVLKLRGDVIKNQEQQLQAKDEEIKEIKDFVGYCFDLQLVGCSNTEKYEGIKNRADEILKGYENARK